MRQEIIGDESRQQQADRCKEMAEYQRGEGNGSRSDDVQQMAGKMMQIVGQIQ